MQIKAKYLRFCFLHSNAETRSCERKMTQRKMRSDQVGDILTTWNTDDELSSDEEDAISQSLSIPAGVSSAILDSGSSGEDESDHESTTNTQDATVNDTVGRNRTIETNLY